MGNFSLKCLKLYVYSCLEQYSILFIYDVLYKWILTFCAVLFEDDTQWLDTTHFDRYSIWSNWNIFCDCGRVVFEDSDTKMRHKKGLDWQRQYLPMRPLVLCRNFKYVKLSRILLAISFIVCCHFSSGEPISTIDASSSIPGKNDKDTYHYLFISLIQYYEYQFLNNRWNNILMV